MDRRRSLLKIAALRTEREHQQGVDCSQGYLQSPAAGLLAEGPRTLECLFKYAPSDKMQMISGFGSSMMEVDVLSSANQIRFYCGNTFATAAIVLENNYLAHISYDGTTAICYLNGTEAARFTVTGYKVADLFRTGSPSYAPKGSLVFCRHYNYALSGEEVATHYNNGDPAGYVLPGTYKGEGNSYESDFSTSSERWTPLDGAVLTYDEINHVVELNSGNNRSADMYSPITYDTRKAHVYNIEVIIDKNTAVSRCRFFPYTSYESIYLTAEDNDDITILKGVYIPAYGYLFSSNLYCYFSLSTPTTVRVRSIRVTPVGCVAEYLPQNLVGDNNGIASSWLDSAKQLPLNDEYLPPLLETTGGYDLTANGTPKIVNKPALVKVEGIDLINPSNCIIAWGTDQKDAFYVIEKGAIRLKCGIKTNPDRPFLWVMSHTCIPGRKYRFRVKYTLLNGNIHLYGYGDLKTDDIHVVQGAGDFDTDRRQYEYTTPIMNYDQINSRFNRCVLYWGNSISNSEFTIDEIKIEEYE